MSQHQSQLRSLRRSPSTYEIFRALELELCLQEIGHFPKTTSPTVEYFDQYADLATRFPVRPSRYASLVLKDDWFLHLKNSSVDEEQTAHLTADMHSRWMSVRGEIRLYVSTVASIIKNRRDLIRKNAKAGMVTDTTRKLATKVSPAASLKSSQANFDQDVMKVQGVGVVSSHGVASAPTQFPEEEARRVSNPGMAPAQGMPTIYPREPPAMLQVPPQARSTAFQPNLCQTVGVSLPEAQVQVHPTDDVPKMAFQSYMPIGKSRRASLPNFASATQGTPSVFDANQEPNPKHNASVFQPNERLHGRRSSLPAMNAHDLAVHNELDGISATVTSQSAPSVFDANQEPNPKHNASVFQPNERLHGRRSSLPAMNANDLAVHKELDRISAAVASQMFANSNQTMLCQPVQPDTEGMWEREIANMRAWARQFRSVKRAPLNNAKPASNGQAKKDVRQVDISSDAILDYYHSLDL